MSGKNQSGDRHLDFHDLEVQLAAIPSEGGELAIPEAAGIFAAVMTGSGPTTLEKLAAGIAAVSGAIAMRSVFNRAEYARRVRAFLVHLVRLMASQQRRMHAENVTRSNILDVLEEAVGEAAAEPDEARRDNLAAMLVSILAAGAPVEYRDALQLLRFSRELHHDHIQVLRVLAEAKPVTEGRMMLPQLLAVRTGVDAGRIERVISHDLKTAGLVGGDLSGFHAGTPEKMRELLLERGRDFVRFALGIESSPPV